MTEFIDQDLADSHFEETTLRGATFRNVGLANARFEMVDLTGVTIKWAYVFDVTIDADIRNVVINGVDVVPLIQAELDRRYPGRAKMRPTDPDGFREAWALLERLWQETVDRARTFPPEMLHERVDGEWSFIETLRHLVFATDGWINRALLGDPSPWHPLGLPHDEMDDKPGIPRDRDARPSLDEILAVRAERMATMKEVLAHLTEEKLSSTSEPVVGPPGHPEGDDIPVMVILSCILEEEWEHRIYAERDFDKLAPREA